MTQVLGHVAAYSSSTGTGCQFPAALCERQLSSPLPCPSPFQTSSSVAGLDPLAKDGSEPPIFCFDLLRAEITSVCYKLWFMWCWRWNRGLLNTTQALYQPSMSQPLESFPWFSTGCPAVQYANRVGLFLKVSHKDFLGIHKWTPLSITSEHEHSTHCKK